MPWCPICKYEYRVGFNRCKDCNVDLVEELVVEIKESIIEEESKTQKSYFEEEAFMTNVDDEYSVDIIKDFFELDGIPVLTKYKGTGNLHSLFMGIDVYVPLKQLEEAKQLLNDLEIGNETIVQENNIEVQEQDVKSLNMRQHIFLIILCIIILTSYFIWMFQKVAK